MHRTAVRRAVVITLALLFGVATASPSAAKGGGGVLPAKARPHGYSLTQMGLETANFSLSGNDPDLLPDTPFQVLYVDPSTLAFVPDNGGLLATGTNTFTVEVGTPFYVPLFSVNDLPPVLGVFPTTREEAIDYFFDPSQVGGEGFEVIVDGKSTPIGPAYLTGPVTTVFDGQEVQVITLGAFIHPLPPGTHTVTIRGGVFGDLVAETFGIDSLSEEFTYTVNVVRPS